MIVAFEGHQGLIRPFLSAMLPSAPVSTKRDLVAYLFLQVK